MRNKLRRNSGNILMTETAVIVFTAKSIEHILGAGGTQAWRLDPKHARQCAFAVCTRNAKAHWVEGREVHHSAFLVGKIRAVVPSLAEPEYKRKASAEDRYLIQFSGYTLVDIPNVWQQGLQNPVRYQPLRDLGIDPSTLQWEMMPESPVRLPKALLIDHR